MRKFLNKTMLLFLVAIIILLIISGIFITKILPNLNFASMNKIVYPTFELESQRDLSKNQMLQSEIYSLSNSHSGLKLIKKGSTTIEVDFGKFYETLNKLYALVNQYNGNLINSNLYKEDKYNSGYFTFMIPSKDLDSFINKLNELGKIKNLTITTTDVSEEYFDISGRLKILESQRELLLSWLEKAKDIKDMLSIRSELQNVETEIEKIKGRMNYIDYHSEFSEITVILEEKREDIPFWKKSEILKILISGFTYALKTILNSIIFLIIFISFAFPWVLFGYLLYLLYKKLKNKL